MYLNILSAVISNIFYLFLHVASPSNFPKPLSAKQERECLEAIKNGDHKARDTLIAHNLRLVAHIVKKYYSACDQNEDLISIGTIGLIKSAETFDSSKKVRFATYASKCIENEILMSFRAKRKSAGDLYISDPIDTDSNGNSITLMDLMSDEDDLVGKIELNRQISDLYTYIGSVLNEREREIIRMRYGLGNSLPMTQREVAKKLGISRSYVSRLETKALAKLKEQFDKR